MAKFLQVNKVCGQVYGHVGRYLVVAATKTKRYVPCLSGDGTGLGYSSRSTLLRDQLAITLSDGSKRSRMEGLSGFKRDLVRSWRKGTSDDVVHHLM